MDFLVSVIIPTYNVEKFIQKTVLSVINNIYVKEVIIVDDGSQDNTLNEVYSLSENFPKVKLFFHKDYKNKGRSATRNLGIIKATAPFIAFLDADDYYDVNRFLVDQKIFSQNPEIEGVYNAVGYDFYREIQPEEKSFFKLNTLTQRIDSEDLFEALISNRYGYLHLNGLTIRKDVFNKIGLFKEDLKVAEDSDLFFKLSLKSKLTYGEINNAVAKRGIHDNNIFNNKEVYKIYNTKLYEGLVDWSLKRKINKEKINLIFKYYWIIRYRENKGLLYETKYWIFYIIKKPRILFSIFSIKYMPIVQHRKQLFPFLFK